ncbi:uncharacterized protein LOC120338913 isoform X2 [Styela clava]|uniref:uncharacterized protein LOC120338913 isoform X2 n=1 Tax=Styela clava TaxID=7725 RepID=UPI00193A4177|nr:uncharacterized protein LOC120338913 isoform X2 [Styela clava]
MWNLVVVVFIVDVTFLQVSCREHQKSSSTLNDIQYRRYLNKGASVDCFDAFDECRKVKECRTALRGLNKRCKVVSGRCSAEMVDLPRCGQIMDHLFQYGFPETRCKCDHNLGRCFTMLNKIYANPCFASIRHLRKNDLFPQEITAYDKVGGVEATTFLADVTNSDQLNGQETDMKDELDALKSSTDASFYEEIFGDEGFAKPPPPRNIISPAPSNTELDSVDKKMLVPQSSRFGIIKHSNDISREEEITQEEQNEEFPLSLTEDKHKDMTMKKDTTNYRLIAIILGALLTIFIVSSIIFLTWTRLHGKVLYSPGKIVKDHRREDGIPDSKTNNNEKLSNLYNDSNA